MTVTAPRRLLIVEDEQALGLGLCDLFAGSGYEAASVATGAEAIARCAAARFDIAVVDIMLPDRSGFELCAELKTRWPGLAVIILSACSASSDKVHGLRLGADDYVGKPFDAVELLARVEAVLRRFAAPAARTFAADGIAVDVERGEVYRDGAAVKLSARQFQLLVYLVERRGQLVTRDQLQRDVWGFADDVTTRTVDIHVARLRRLLERNPQTPRLIVTVQGLGYRLV